MINPRQRSILGASCVLAAVLSSCAGEVGSPESSRELTQLGGRTMGTTYSVGVVTEAAPSLATKTEWLEGVEAVLHEVNASMSTYLEDSELSGVNRAAAGEALPVSPSLLEVLLEAARIGELTEGAFDVTVGPLVNAYGFGPDAPASPPDEAELERLRERTGARHLTIDPAGTLAKARDDLYIDLSALAKGYAVDRVARFLEERGAADFMVEVGGEVVARGSNVDGEPWRIGVERPEADLTTAGRALQRIVPLTDVAMATSGDYRNFREVDGERWTHIVDPRSGRSVHHRLASVTVLHDSCMTADGLATALIVLGPEEAIAFAEQHDLAALFLLRTGFEDGRETFEEEVSSAWSRLHSN